VGSVDGVDGAVAGGLAVEVVKNRISHEWTRMDTNKTRRNWGDGLAFAGLAGRGIQRAFSHQIL
jgi:hypothetical protein